MCENYLILMDDLLEGELDAQSADKVKSHIFACRHCEAEFEMLKSEKEIYSQFLFEIEPPKHLAEKFQAKLETENAENRASVKTFPIFSDWKAKTFGNASFYPALAFGIAILVFGLGFVWLNWSKNNNEVMTKAILQPEKPSVKSSEFSEAEKFEVKKQIIALPPAKPEKVVFSKKDKKRETVVSAKVKRVKMVAETLIVKTSEPKKKIISVNKPENAGLTKADEMRIIQIRSFQVETAKQMEKVELLLRSFRNARFVEGSEQFDVEYEKQQAGKLLAKNIQLRQQAEDYGTILTSEMLGKVEPYLLEISNLDTNPSEEEVLEIKQRVKNQNIIVSLQSF